MESFPKYALFRLLNTRQFWWVHNHAESVGFTGPCLTIRGTRAHAISMTLVSMVIQMALRSKGFIAPLVRAVVRLLTSVQS